jgi:hypothetical protein
MVSHTFARGSDRRDDTAKAELVTCPYNDWTQEMGGGLDGAPEIDCWPPIGSMERLSVLS